MTCFRYFRVLKPESQKGMKMITTCLAMLVTFTSTSTWPLLKSKAGLFNASMFPSSSDVCVVLNRTVFFVLRGGGRGWKTTFTKFGSHASHNAVDLLRI